MNDVSKTIGSLLVSAEDCVAQYRSLAINGMDTASCRHYALDLFDKIHVSLGSMDIPGRSHAISALYSLVYGAFPVADSRLLSVCHAECEAFLRENFDGADALSLCRCLLDFFYPEREDGDKWFDFLAATVSEWDAKPASTLSPEECELAGKFHVFFG